jgi:hypothetical protein
MIKVVAVVANGAVGRGFCRLLEMDGDIEVVSSAESLPTVDVHACRHDKLIVVVGPNIPFGGKPDTWDGLDVILVSPIPKPGRLPGVTEVPMELTGSAMRALIRRLAAGSLDG